jgi:HAMP domain
VSKPVESTSRDELGDVARAFDRSFAHLRALSSSATEIAAGDLTVDARSRRRTTRWARRSAR